MRSISVSQLCNRSNNLHLCGYSEEVLDNLIQNGDLQGHFDSDNGELMVDTEGIRDFLPLILQHGETMENQQSEKANHIDATGACFEKF